VFAHLPLLLNPDKSKLSKRQGDVAVEDYRSKGYLPEALVNFVALLGWNPGDEREIFTVDELIREFSLERVGKAGAVFNIEKLNWLNAQHLRKKTGEEILRLVREYLSRSPFGKHHYGDAYLLRVIAAMRERAIFVGDFVEKSPYFFEPPGSFDPDVMKKRWKRETPGQLRKLADEFGGLTDPKKESFEAALHRVATALNVKNGDLIHPLRLAVSGMGSGPGVFEILEILGKGETIRRIAAAMEKLS
jgi:glutamyl-tRNA synthetase